MATWKQIPFEPKYSVSEFGEVRNDKTGLILKPWILKTGYAQLKLGHKNAYTIHRLVAMVFHSLSEKIGDYVLHIDNNKLNNHYLNLKWGTQSDNLKQAYAEGRHNKKGERHHLAKFTVKQVHEIRLRIKNGERVCNLARELGVCHQTISSIKMLKNWK